MIMLTVTVPPGGTGDTAPLTVMDVVPEVLAPLEGVTVLTVVVVTVPTTVATCAAVPLLTPETVTTAFRVPAVDGSAVNVYVSEVIVDAVTLPAILVDPAPENATELFAAVAEKFVPAMVSVVWVPGRFAVLAVTVGVATVIVRLVPVAPTKFCCCAQRIVYVPAPLLGTV
jgi:hypothetical protein